MAANKQVIFDLEDKAVPLPIADKQPGDIPVPATNHDPVTNKTKKGPMNNSKKTQTQKAKTAQETHRAKNSDLGVRVSLKQITASPIPHVLPSTQPNQPVITQGQPVLPITDAANHLAMFNPATKHPVVVNDGKQQGIKNKSTAYKPEITHPATLPAAATKSTKKKTGKKQKVIDFKKRLELKTAMAAEKDAQKAAKKAAAEVEATIEKKTKSTKNNLTGKKLSRRTTSKKPKENIMF
jgi:hypothetical protein